MRRYLYSNLLEMLFGALLMLIFIPSVIYLVCSLVIHQNLSIETLVYMAACCLSWSILKLIVHILNNVSNNSIIFSDGKITYKDRTIYSDSATIKYFKFYISIIEPCLVIPKIYITSNDLSVLCYISKKDVKMLKKMNFEVKEI